MAEEIIQRPVPEQIDIEENILSYVNWDKEMAESRKKAQEEAETVRDFNLKLDEISTYESRKAEYDIALLGILNAASRQIGMDALEKRIRNASDSELIIMRKQKLIKIYKAVAVPIIEEIKSLKIEYDELQLQLEQLALRYEKAISDQEKEDIRYKAQRIKANLRDIEEKLRVKEKIKQEKKKELKQLEKEENPKGIRAQLLSRVEKIIAKDSKDREANILCNIPNDFTYEQIDQLAQFLEEYAEGNLAFSNFKMEIPQSLLEMLSMPNYRDFTGNLGNVIDKPNNEISLTNDAKSHIDCYLDDYQAALQELGKLSKLRNSKDLLKTFYSRKPESFLAGTEEHEKLVELYTNCANYSINTTLESLLDREEELKADKNRGPLFKGLICKKRIENNENKIQYLSKYPLKQWFEDWIEDIADKLGIAEFKEMIEKAKDGDFDNLDLNKIYALASEKKEKISEFRKVYSERLEDEKGKANSKINNAKNNIYNILNLSKLTYSQKQYQDYKIPVIEGGITEILKRIANSRPIPDFSEEAQKDIESRIIKNIEIDKDKIRKMIDHGYLNKDENPDLEAVHDFIENDGPVFYK